MPNARFRKLLLVTSAVFLIAALALIPFYLKGQPSDDFQHVIVATQNGDVNEVFFNSSIGSYVTHPASAILSRQWA
jgi:hypothetical protein